MAAAAGRGIDCRRRLGRFVVGTGQVCAVVQARGVDGVDKVVRMMETGDIWEAEVIF